MFNDSVDWDLYPLICFIISISIKYSYLWNSIMNGLCSLQVGKHGIIIEFTDSDYNTRRSATYLPEVAAHEGKHFHFL